MKNFILLMLLYFLPAQIFAKDTLIVGVKDTPPFIIVNNKNYSGISIDLWEKIAVKTNIKFEYKEYDFLGLLNAIETGEIDLSIAPYTVTSSRMRKFDFLQPFFVSNLTIAVPLQNENSALDFISRLLSIEFLKIIVLLFLILLIFGFFIWLAERKQNLDFKEDLKGLGHGIWWSAVTMTTVGYGDKTPRTFAGRVVGVIWMFTAVIIISSFTGSIAASLTVDKIDGKINKIEDLKTVQVGSIEGSTSGAYLESKSINYRSFSSVRQGLYMLAIGKLDAFVYDAPIIKHIIKSDELQDKVQTLQLSFNPQFYSFSLPTNHELRDSINPVLMEVLESEDWDKILNMYSLSE